MCSSKFGSSGFANRLFILLLFVFSLKVRKFAPLLLRGFIQRRVEYYSYYEERNAERTVNEGETTRRSTFATATTRVRAKRVQQLPEERRRSFLVFGRRKRDDEYWFRKPIRRRESTRALPTNRTKILRREYIGGYRTERGVRALEETRGDDRILRHARKTEESSESVSVQHAQQRPSK